MKNIKLLFAMIFTAFSINSNTKAMISTKPFNLSKDFLKETALAILEKPEKREQLYGMLTEQEKKELLRVTVMFNVNEAISEAISETTPKNRFEILDGAPKSVLASFVKQGLIEFLLLEFGSENPRPGNRFNGTLPERLIDKLNSTKTSEKDSIETLENIF